MKAIRIHQYGDASALVLDNVDQPRAGDGEVLLRVQAAGVNPIDWMVRAGYLQGMIPHAMPLTLGWDVAGTVEAVGQGVTAFAKGDEVYGQLDVTKNGAYAEYVVSAADRLSRKPASFSFAEAAGVPIAAMAAWQAVMGAGELKKGQRVLVHGAAGGVGGYAVQIAKAAGAEVIGSGSAGNEAYVKSLGADTFIDYNAKKFETLVRDVDIVVDTVGGDTQARSWGVLRSGGLLASMVGDQWAGEPRDDVRKAAIYGAMAPLAQISALIDAGKVKALPVETLPLADAARAHQQIETRHVRGKIVLKVA